MLTPAVRTVQKGLTSVKDKMAESWALSESEDEDEYFQRVAPQYADDDASDVDGKGGYVMRIAAQNGGSAIGAASGIVGNVECGLL